MRIIGHSLLLIALLAVAAIAIVLGSEWLGTTGFLPGPNGIRASRSTAYRVPTTSWLAFGLSERGPIRVLSNCAFESTAETESRYALDYELLDSGGEIVLSGRYHHRAQITLLIEAGQKRDAQPISKTSFADFQRPGSNAADFWIETEDLELPGTLRVRIADQAREIVEISARAYQRTELSPRKAKSAWQRLSRRKREEFARGLAVSSEWLEPFETTALARFDWRPLGPRGVEERDYEERLLLVVSDPKFERARNSIQSAGPIHHFQKERLE